MLITLALYLSLPILQLELLVAWYRRWAPSQRDKFFDLLLDRVASNPLAELTDSLAFGLRATRAPDTFDHQAAMVFKWFADWSDIERNRMLNELELHDTERVYAFIDRYRSVRW